MSLRQGQAKGRWRAVQRPEPRKHASRVWCGHVNVRSWPFGTISGAYACMRVPAWGVPSRERYGQFQKVPSFTPVGEPTRTSAIDPKRTFEVTVTASADQSRRTLRSRISACPVAIPEASRALSPSFLKCGTGIQKPPVRGSNPITDATVRRRRAGSHNGPHGLTRCTLV
jgi:hypothetical protein